MPTYRVTDSVSGVTLDLTGDSPPTNTELFEIFSQYEQKPPEQVPEPVEDQSILRSVADVPLQFATGISQGVRFISDAFGADNAVSQNLRGVEDYLGSLLSAQAQNDREEVGRIFQEAQDKGLGEQLAAGLRAIAVSPVDFLAQGLGTAVPTIAGGLAGAALRGGTLAARAATAARVGTGIGAVSGTGIVKSTIYDEVKRELEAAGVDEEIAEERAKLAQEYGGENLDQILLGAGLGGLAAGTGLEKVFASRILKNAGIVPKSLKTAAFAGAKEAAPEFIQAAQEQIAGNVALQREGFEDIPTMRGVATAAALEGAIGFGLGAGINVALPAQQQQQYNAARANITNEVDREREVALRADETKRAQEFVAALNAENQRRLAGQDQQVNIDAEAAAARKRAADIAAPNQDEVNELATPMRGVDISNDVQFGVAYGQKIARTLGDYFPNSGQFSVTQGDTVRDKAGEPQPTFAIIDTEGNRYGQPLRTFEQANATAYSLNKEVINQNVRGAILNSLETSGQPYDPETTQRLFSYGYRTLNPDANLFSTVAINEAAQTVGPQYAEALSWRQLEALPQVKKKGKVVGYEYTPEGGQTRIITGLTKAQEINKVRSQEGKAESSVFNLEETRANLGNNFSRLTKDIPIDLQTTPLSQPTLEFIRNYDAVTGRPITSFYKNAVLNAVTDLLRSKNVTSKIDSPEINALSNSLIGKDSVKGMDYGESRLFLKKLAGLPRFEKPTQLPVFEFKPYNRENFVRASKFLQQSNAQGAKPDRDQILEAAGISKEDPKVDEKFSALETDLAKQGVRNEPQKPLALPAPPGGNIDLESLRKTLRAKLKGFGLQDINLSLERNLIKPTGEIAPEETEAMFIPAMKQVFLAVDRIDPDGSLTPEQRLNALSEVLGHEIIHALRLLDLWKPTEWSSLEKAVSQIKKPGTNQTYLQIAQRNYADQNAVIQIEEAVADMYRDYVGKRLKIAGKPQNLLERLSQFFQRLSSALAGTGFQTYGDVINRLESGVIGARQRGEIRTLRATEEAVAEAGGIPERLRGILGTSIPRAAAVSPAAPVTPAAPTVPSTARPEDFDVGALAGADVRESRLPDTYPTAYQRRSVKTPSKATPKDVEMAEEYQNRTGQMPYLSDGQLQPEIPDVRYSIKRPYETKDLAKGKENDPILGLPLNKNGTVTLYYPATNEAARRTIQDKRLKGSTPTSNRIYLTNESSGPKVMQNPGNIDQSMDGANVLIQVDPSLLHIDQEYEDGRKDFFIQLAEGDSYANKMKQTKLFTLDAPRTRALSKDTKLVDIERSVSNSIGQYLSLDEKGKRARLKQARDVLKKEHNVGTLMGENGKLQKTRLGDYGLTYEGKSVASMGLGLASAQRINEQNLSTCPKSAICEGLCLGETSGQNRLYGGEGQFKSGPRLSQYLKTEALVQHPEDFSIVLFEEISRFQKWANSEKGVEQVENESGETVMQPKQVYQPAIRLNVTSDFRPQTFASIINAFPDVMFYDYTKLPTRSIAPNHHLTYSSTGASQIVNGETIVNPETNWDKMVQQLNNGMNVAMAFTSRTDIPDFVVDERTGQRFQVWDGDNYDARFLDPKREDGIGMIVGLTNKDSTTKPEEAAKKNRGFFLDYDRARDGDALVIPNQGRLRIGAAPQGPVAEAARPPAAREARRGPPRQVQAAQTQPGPAVNTDSTSTAEALNNGQPVNSMGVSIGPVIGDTEPEGTVDISRARISPLTRRLVSQLIQSAPDKLRAGFGLDNLASRIENYYDGYAAKLGLVNNFIRNAYRNIGLGGRKSAIETFDRYMRARENKKPNEALSILNNASENDRQLIDAWNKISIETGRINKEVRTPDGEPMKVYDSKWNDGKGGWRNIGTVGDFFPRTFRREVMEVMKNPDLDPQLWKSLLDSLVQSDRADIKTAADAEKYLIREWFSDEVKNDYFAGVEKARTQALPEIFYDYSWDAATRYLNKWARRTSQIENFGQELGKFKKEWFGTNIPNIRDQETQNYVNTIRERIYEIEPFDTLSNMANWLNSLATATQLGNPISASLNLFGGTIANIQEFGIIAVTKSYLDLLADWRKIQEEGTTLGILNKDFMNILRDHVEMDADKYFSKEQKISQSLARFANTALTFGGFNAAENVVRSSAMLAARARLNTFLKKVNDNPDSANVKKFYAYANRENLNINALILENGSGKETEKYMRRAVNIPQGSYQIDMTPVFIDTTAGRFFFKYQKFGTQINRFYYNHFLKPILTEKGRRGRNILRALGFVGTAIVGGGAILAIREAFGYGDPGPDLDELDKALEDEDTARAWALILSRSMENIMAAGSFGFFGNYAQFAKDWQDQQRVKNPMNPPGLASVDAVIDVFNRLRDQKTITARDLDEIAETTMSFYRANKRIGLALMDEIGSDAKEVERFSAFKDLREIREYSRRFSDEMGIEFKRSTAPGSPIRTEMTPINKAITDALHVGNAAAARLIMREAVMKVPPKDRQQIRQSIQSSIRNRQPLQVGGNAPSKQERLLFIRWAKQNLPKEKVELVIREDREYRRAAARIGMGI